MQSEEELLRRMERLEKQNKKLRLVSILTCLLLITMMTMAQKASKKIYGTIEASAITLKDEKGAGRIKILPKGIEFYDKEGKFAGAVREDITILGTIKAAEYSAFDMNGRDRIRLAMNGQRPAIQMMNEEGRVRTAIGEEAIVLFGNTNNEYNSLLSDRISIRDASAATATLGVTETANKDTKKVIRSSVASITLFGRDGNVIWQAP